MIGLPRLVSLLDAPQRGPASSRIAHVVLLRIKAYLCEQPAAGLAHAAYAERFGEHAPQLNLKHEIPQRLGGPSVGAAR